MAIICIMADGLGLAPASDDNPLAHAPMPAVRQLLGNSLTHEAIGVRPGLLLQPIDATLGIAGLPQSGTGHTSILGGFNAAAAVGRHQPNFPPTALRQRLAEQNLFHAVQQHGKRAAFANVFGPNYWQALAHGRLRKAAAVLAAEGAGVRLHTSNDYQAGRAVAWDITAELLQAREPDLAPVTPQAAAQALVQIASDNDLVYYETYLPDLAAHGRLAQPAGTEAQVAYALDLLDQLLGALLAGMPGHATLVLLSDHGNLESRSAPSHTRNPVPLLVVGPAVAPFQAITSIADVASVVAQTC